MQLYPTKISALERSGKLKYLENLQIQGGAFFMHSTVSGYNELRIDKKIFLNNSSFKKILFAYYSPYSKASKNTVSVTKRISDGLKTSKLSSKPVKNAKNTIFRMQ